MGDCINSAAVGYKSDGRERTILHCDCNAFFASVEESLNPSLREVPMAVCGDPEKRHGIILAKNQKAKKYNINVGEAIWQAKQKCPALVLAVPHHRLYAEYSARINKIYREYTDLVEPFGIDESWLDVTGSSMRFGDGKKIADELRARIKKQEGITISVGVSFNKIFAKLGSDYKKPDATTVITSENFRRIVFPLPASELMFVGSAMSAELSRMCIKTIGDIAAAGRDFLERRLGKPGATLYEYASGLDSAPVVPVGHKEQVKSVSNGFTFLHDIVDPEELKTAVVALSDEVAARMRGYGVKGRTVKVFVRTSDLKVYGKQKGIAAPTNLYSVIASNAMELLGLLDWNGMPIRSLTVAMSNILGADSYAAEQVWMFAPDPAAPFKRETLESAIDGIRARYGKDAIMPASLLSNTLGIDRTAEKQSDYHTVII